MLGELTPEQINAVLFNEVVGRIGSHGEGRTYVYEALQGKEAFDALQILVARLMPLVTSETLRLPDGPSLAAAKPLINAPKTIIYRIRVTERTGRFEKR